jgi:hypothetical protein
MTRSRAEKARKALARLERVTDNGMLLMAIRYYAKNLTPGAWTLLDPSRRAGSRKVNAKWPAHLWAARRILNIAARKEKQGCSYKLPANYTCYLWPATGLDLDNALVRRELEKVPYDFRLNDPKTNAFSRQHPHVLERAKKHLLQHYGRSTLRRQVTAEALEGATITQESQQMPIHATGLLPLTAQQAFAPKPPRPILVRPPTVERVLRDRVQGFLSRIISED